MPLKKYRRSPGGNYYLRGTVAGRSIHESTGTRDAARADAIRIRREAELLDRHAYGKAATLTFTEAALTYMQSGGEARYLGPILRHFGPDKLLSEIDNAEILKAEAALYPNAAAATVQRQLITPISAVVNMAAEDGLTSPRKFKRRKGDRIRTRWLTPEEAERLIEAAAELHPHIVPAIGIMLGGGTRAGEALTLEMRHFYPATGEAWIKEAKNGEPRMIRLPSRALDMVRSRPLPDAGVICLTPKGKPYVVGAGSGGQIAAAFGDAVEQAGLDRKEVTPHVLRHTWATWFYAQTHDFGGLLDFGGWKKADMAQRYRKIAPADLADRLRAHGWNFSQLGPMAGASEQKPAAPKTTQRPHLRVIK
ncbi:tyrosine-type recombinase/integrase [Salipiger thiooxidans]|uniref:tyrosine-type recombinase/integrase n=1 Tax=Salipiger thiooxidans TaxID=282683 RepID=UPI001CD1B67C|nr:site-specific integrase [Salipiger thiooxidans]MCA0851216.1 site-specific integrase [Salipiger thiooxidans]